MNKNEYAREWRKKNYLRNKLIRIKYRCKTTKGNGYFYYGFRGIKCELSLEDLEFLWKKYDGSKMTRPVIDRFDPYGNYTISNCRFLEAEENRKRALWSNKVEWKKLAEVQNARTKGSGSLD